MSWKKQLVGVLHSMPIPVDSPAYLIFCTAYSNDSNVICTNANILKTTFNMSHYASLYIAHHLLQNP